MYFYWWIKKSIINIIKYHYRLSTNAVIRGFMTQGFPLAFHASKTLWLVLHSKWCSISIVYVFDVKSYTFTDNIIFIFYLCIVSLLSRYVFRSNENRARDNALVLVVTKVDIHRLFTALSRWRRRRRGTRV